MKSMLAFGDGLRTLRESRALSLRDVADHVRRLTRDSGGQVSHAYLNQLENGLPVALSLPKLLSLAAVYNVAVQTIIADLPEPLRAQRLADLESWTARGHAIPERLIRVPRPHERTDAQLDELFAKRARGFAVDWEWKSASEREARGFLPYAILPPVLENSPELASDFWKLHPPGDWPQSYIAGSAGALAMIPLSPWGEITSRFVAWATHATDAIVSAIGLVSWWTLDFTTSGASCHFVTPERDACYGFDSVPPQVVVAVRRWQMARPLFQYGAPQNWPAPPDPIEGTRQFVEYLLRPQPFLPEHAPDQPMPAAVICGSLSALARLVPELRSAAAQTDDELVRAVASLLNRAMDKGLAPPDQKAHGARSRRRTAARSKR